MKQNMSTLSAAVIAAVSILFLSPEANARSTKLVEPDTVTISCDLPAEKMREGIIKGGAVRNWVVVNETPTDIELMYQKGNYKHTITVNVSYTDNTFAIFYKDSTNLNYKVKRNGTRLIHPKPVLWMSNLNRDIQKTTNNLCYLNNAPQY